jgi:uroporphyrinogen decarboxylase
MDLLVNRKFAEALMDQLAEANIRRFERYAATVGQHVHVVQFEDDLGMQDRPLLRPDLYREVVKPYHEKLFRSVKSRCDAYLLLHTDGTVSSFIPDFIDMGVDILNPVQVSAAGMDTKALKREFGRDITFWGGGCDSQHVLRHSTRGRGRGETPDRCPGSWGRLCVRPDPQRAGRGAPGERRRHVQGGPGARCVRWARTVMVGI